MCRKYFIAAALTALLTNPACSDLEGSPASPSFTSDELVVINRNVSLREISKSNPWMVRRLLDALEKVEPGSITSQSPAPSGKPTDDPDLGRMQRASPEAVHDLFQLLKQAGQKK